MILIKNYRKQIQGFTLVELIVTILTEGFMIIVVMALLINMKARLLQQKADMALLSEYRAAKITIRKELLDSWNVDIDTTTETDMNLYKLDGATRTISLNGTNIEIDNPLRVILSSVTAASFTYPSTSTLRMIDIFIEQERAYEHIQGGSHKVNLSSTFTVCVRNDSL